VEEGLEKADTESGRLVEDMIFAFIWRLTSWLWIFASWAVIWLQDL
jgi:hypothetical protein